ncbi:MAG: terminase family protein [Proteobacteria bacterium]|nr:terminase family protein [Pseudomonadota bacterium]
MFVTPEYIPSHQAIHFHEQIKDIPPEKLGLGSIYPQWGPQTEFCLTGATVTIFGGGGGGGKTYGSLLCGISQVQNFPGFDITMFRLTMADAKKPNSLVDETAKLYPNIGGSYHGTDHRWTMPNGSTISLAHLNHEKHLESQKGGQFGGVIFDELTNFPGRFFWYLMTRLRSVSGGLPFIKATTNPQHEGWVRDLLIKGGYIDPLTGFAIWAMSGVVKYIYRGEDDEIVFFASRKEALLWWKINFPTEWARYKDGDRQLREPISFTFIPSLLEHNKILEQIDPQYRANLENQPYADRMQLLYGNWNAVQEKGSWFHPSMVGKRINAESIPTDIIKCRGWDLGYTAPKPGKDPDYTVGVLLGWSPSTLLTYVIDVAYCRKEGAELNSFIEETAIADSVRFGGRTGFTISLPAGGTEKQIASNLALNQLRGFKVHTSREEGSKEDRFHGFSSAAKASGVRVVENHAWNDIWFNQLTAFKGKLTRGHDDCVDATSRAYDYVISASRKTTWSAKRYI